MSDQEKHETALILASSRRVSKRGFSDTRPCRICGFDRELKDVIEGLLGTGLAMRPILNLVNSIIEVKEPDSSRLSMSTLEQHRKGHIPIRLFMQREVIERRAKAASKDLEQEDGNIMTPAAYAEIMMNAGAENLINNPESVSPMEGLAAAKTLHEFDSIDNADVEIARMVSDLQKITIAVKAVCSPSQLETISYMIGSDKQRGSDDIDIV